jgi:hypothetical protein
MRDTYEERYAAAIRSLEGARMSRLASRPPWLGPMRRLGLRPLPPHFASFWANVMGHGLVFTFALGVLMWLVAWRDAVPPQAAAVTAVLLGLFFGLVVAFLYRATAERSGLVRWEDLPPG